MNSNEPTLQQVSPAPQVKHVELTQRLSAAETQHAAALRAKVVEVHDTAERLKACEAQLLQVIVLDS